MQKYDSVSPCVYNQIFSGLIFNTVKIQWILLLTSLLVLHHDFQRMVSPLKSSSTTGLRKLTTLTKNSPIRVHLENTPSHLTPLLHTALLRRVSIRTSGVPISFTANLRISLIARGALFLKPLQLQNIVV